MARTRPQEGRLQEEALAAQQFAEQRLGSLLRQSKVQVLGLQQEAEQQQALQGDRCVGAAVQHISPVVVGLTCSGRDCHQKRGKSTVFARLLPAALLEAAASFPSGPSMHPHFHTCLPPPGCTAP